MFVKVLLLLLVYIFTPANGGPIERQISGNVSYVVSLRLYGTHICTASLVSNRFVLTTADCAESYPTAALSIQYGELTSKSTFENLKVTPVKSISLHSDGYANDVAVLELKRPIDGTLFKPVLLPSGKPSAFEQTLTDEDATLLQWTYNELEKHSTPYLKRLYIEVHSDETCEEIYEGVVPFDSEYQLCGAGELTRGQCEGESGGPLLVDGVQVGMASWNGEDCRLIEMTAIYYKVSAYVKEIKKIVKQ